MTTHHTSGAADLPVITRKDRQFLHDNPNTDDLVAWVQDYAARAVALAAGQAVAPEKGITVDFSQAHELLEMFGGEPGLVTLHHGNEKSHSGAGLYAWWTDMPEEGAQFLGAQPDDEAVPVRPAPPAMDGGEDAERWEFRWLNPANQQNVAPSELAWKTVNSKGMRSEKEALEDLKTYRYQGKPVYELRPLFTTRALQKPEIRCPVRLANGGDCPRHNLQCGWPDCNKETK